MMNEIVSALEAAVGRWVCKKDASSPPALLTQSDVHDLAMAATAGMSDPASPEGEREWGNLRELTKSWVVQQKPGAKPGPLEVQDFEHLAALISPVLPASEPVSSVVRQNDTTPVQSDVGRWTYEAADLTFAREHLERCL